ncbi:MAG: MoaD/ThiS family protein [Anaerolineales bacterium]|nr:MoaD/ThiS family protein [Anaerolineales bacterium]
MPSFRIPTPLRPYVADNSQVDVSGATVGDALTDLTAQFPDIRQHLFDGEELRSFVNIYLNKEDVRFLEGKATPVEERDMLLIVPSIAGGC